MSANIDHINSREVLRMIKDNEAPDSGDFCANLTDEILLQLWRAINNNAGPGGAVKSGRNITGAITANTLYHFRFTDITGALMTYANANYILQAVDPVTLEVVNVDFLAGSDTTGIYTPVNAFRLRTTANLPNGLIIRHNGK